MHILCPNCSSTYEVPDSVFGGRARRLRCENCGHQWKAGPPEDESEGLISAPGAEAWPEAPQPLTAGEPRQFGLSVDEQAKAEFQKAVHREAGATSGAAPSGGGEGLTNPGEFPPESILAAAPEAMDDDMDRFISLVHAARSKAIEFEPELPPKPKLNLANPVIMGALIVLLVAALLFAERGLLARLF
ncbi:MAG: zinc-ribbon domain-containing protein [Acidocella sp.]|nr:zinc-ribbon domain-containing protein [Acidocella sp.]